MQKDEISMLKATMYFFYGRDARSGPHLGCTLHKHWPSQMSHEQFIKHREAFRHAGSV